MKKLSTGQDSTLGTYRNIAQLFGDKAVLYFDARIAGARNGKDEEVIADETQMTYFMISLASSDQDKQHD